MSRSAIKNQILSSLSASDWALLEPDLEAVDLPVRRRLANRHARIEHVYFPDQGIASVVADGTGHPIEIGIIGREGMSAIAVIMENERSHHDVFIQVKGHGHRIRADILREADEKSFTLHRVLMRYVHTFFVQVSQTALANGRSTIEERLARWLLLSHDRLDGEEVPMTHDFLSLMLGTPRPGVSTAVGHLREENLIRQQRGSIVIVDRKGLEARCGGIYEAPSKD
jgi:CRP-like cAMP-binding protein